MGAWSSKQYFVPLTFQQQHCSAAALLFETRNPSYLQIMAHSTAKPQCYHVTTRQSVHGRWNLVSGRGNSFLESFFLVQKRNFCNFTRNSCFEMLQLLKCRDTGYLCLPNYGTRTTNSSNADPTLDFYFISPFSR